MSALSQKATSGAERAVPRVSVVVPVFNLGQYLDETIESVLSQTVEDVEIILVDDASSDPLTLERLESRPWPRTTLLRRAENRGPGAARNLGLRQARGEFFCALDADDRLAPRFLEKTLALLEHEPRLAFASCWLQNFGTEDWVWRQEDCSFPRLLVECTVATPALVRRSALLEIGGYDEDRALDSYEDWDLWLSLVERGFEGAVVPEVLFYYRRRPGSLSEAAADTGGHLRLMGHIIAKHRATYERHLLDALASQDAVIAGVLADNYTLEREIEVELDGRIERRRQELASVRGRLARAGAETAPAIALVSSATAALAQSQAVLDEAQGALLLAQRTLDEMGRAREAARHEARALRGSLSWRLTAPLRFVHGLFLRLLGGAR